MNRAICCLLLVFGIALPAQAEKRPMEIADLFRFQRVADPQISPDGKQVVYQITKVNLEENNSATTLWIAATDGKTPPKQLTTTTKSDKHPRWSPDGKQILFESNRSGTSQLWLIDVNGGEAKQITTISTGASNGIWSPDGSRIAFVSSVYPEFSEKPFKESDALNKKKMEEIEKSPVKAKAFTKLFFRHWDEYVDDKRQHLFIFSSPPREGGVSSPNETTPPLREGARKSEPHDVTPGDRDANPTSSTFSVGDDFTFSPNSKYLVFTATPEKDEAWSTNYDICRVPIDNKSTKWEALTKDNKAADNSPRFSANGKKFAYRTQTRAGYEADQWDVTGGDCDPNGDFIGKPHTSRIPDYSVSEFCYYGSKSYMSQVGDKSGSTLFYPGMVSVSYDLGTVNSLSGSREADTVAFLKSTMSQPPEIGFWNGNLLENISHVNDKILAELNLPPPNSVKVPIEGGTMQMWLLIPPGFDEKKKWPVVYLVHGGPQSAWEDGWSYRWNAQLWAAQGYIVAMPNPRGSTGFGQKFVDEITNDWGGKCYEDLMKGVDYLEKLPYVDKDRIASAGGSFGGYMMNWFAVNTPRFKALVTHCSVWNFESMWGTTDELWFDENDHGGLPWEKPEAYSKFSPHKKAGNLGKFKTPMLIIHNDLDFRCPIGQGHELFSALQRQGVPSRFVNFPDEGHWVLKPKNSEHWYKEVFAWLKKYNPPGGR